MNHYPANSVVVGIDPGPREGGISVVDVATAQPLKWASVEFDGVGSLADNPAQLHSIGNAYLHAITRLVGDLPVVVYAVEGFQFMGSKSMNKNILAAGHFAYYLLGRLGQKSCAIHPLEWRKNTAGKSTANDALVWRTLQLLELFPTDSPVPMQKGPRSHLADSAMVGVFCVRLLKQPAIWPVYPQSSVAKVCGSAMQPNQPNEPQTHTQR